jgi:tyrosine-protein kinase Etk/Wzc
MNNNKAKPYEDDGIDFSRVFALISQFKKFILLFGSSLSVLVLLFVLITAIIPPELSPLPNIYKPVSTILINEDPSSDIFPYFLMSTAGASKNGIAISKFSYGELAIRLVKSKAILDVISDEFHIAERYHIESGKKVKSREAILKHLDVDYDDKTMIVTLSYEDYNPEFASKVTNRIVGELEAKFNSLDIARNTGQKEILESKINDVRLTIASLESDIKIYQKKYGFIDVETLAEEETTTVAQARLQLMNKEMEINTKQKLLNIDDPEMKKLFVERDTLSRLVAEFEGGFQSYKSNLPSQKDLPDVAQSFAHLKRELAVQEKIYSLLVQQHELSKLSLAGFLPLIQVIDPADVPDYKDGPQRIIICIAGIVLSFILGAVCAFIFNWMRMMSGKKTEKAAVRK